MSAAEHILFLRFVIEAPRKQSHWLLKHMTPSQLNAVGETCYNLLFGQFDISKLTPYKHIIRALGDRRTALRKRRALVAKHPHAVVQAIRQALTEHDTTNGSHTVG